MSEIQFIVGLALLSVGMFVLGVLVEQVRVQRRELRFEQKIESQFIERLARTSRMAQEEQEILTAARAGRTKRDIGEVVDGHIGGRVCLKNGPDGPIAMRVPVYNDEPEPERGWGNRHAEREAARDGSEDR